MPAPLTSPYRQYCNRPQFYILDDRLCYTPTENGAEGGAAGQVPYIALDRIPVRPLPQAERKLRPDERSAPPEIGVVPVEHRYASVPASDTLCKTVSLRCVGTSLYALSTQRQLPGWLAEHHLLLFGQPSVL